MNISCYAEGCIQPIIGQCPGYKASCGRFYCKRHSVDSLCEECARLKETERIEREYLHLAREIDSKVKRATLGYAVLLSLFVNGCAWLFAYLGLASGRGYLVGLAVGGYFFGLFLVRRWVKKKQQETAVELAWEAERDHVRFADFYHLWKTNKDRKALRKAAETVVVALIGAAIASAVLPEDQMAKDIHDIRNRLD